MTHRLTLNSDLAQVPAQLQIWEYSVANDEDGSQKLRLLIDALSSSMHLRLLSPFINATTTNSYTDLKNAICAAIEQSIGQQIVTPTHRDPLALLKSIKIKFPTATRQEMLDLIRGHLDDEAYQRYRRSTEDLEKLVQLDTELHARERISAITADYGPTLHQAFTAASTPNHNTITKLTEQMDKQNAILQSIVENMQRPAAQVQQVTAGRATGTARPENFDLLINTLNKTVEALTNAYVREQSPSNRLANAPIRRQCGSHERFSIRAYSCKPPCDSFDANVFTEHDQRTGWYYDPIRRRQGRGAGRVNLIAASGDQAPLTNEIQREVQRQLQELLAGTSITPSTSNHNQQA